MAYKGSVSPTVSVEVAKAMRALKLSVYDETSGLPKAGTIKIDGVSHSVPAPGKEISITEGRHTAEVVIPSGYTFTRWYGVFAIVIDDEWSNPTGFNLTGDARITARIKQILINTSLSIAVTPPSPVEPGAALTAMGKLARTDTGAGIGGQTIWVEQPPGTEVKSGVTDSAGNYSISVAAPTVEGVYSYRTSYAGTAGYKGAISQTLSVGVGVVPPGLFEMIASILMATAPVIAVGAVVGAQELRRARVIP